MLSDVPNLAKKELMAMASMPSAFNSLTPKLPKRLDNLPSLPVNNGK